MGRVRDKREGDGVRTSDWVRMRGETRGESETRATPWSRSIPHYTASHSSLYIMHADITLHPGTREASQDSLPARRIRACRLWH